MTPAAQARMSTVYVDGLGRPIQTVVRGGSFAIGDGLRDLVAIADYNSFGQSQYNYLPFVASGTDATNGSFKFDPFQQQSNFMQSQFAQQGETFFYGESEFEETPQGRVLKVMAPGNSWVGSGRGVAVDNLFNTVLDDVHY
ncbi:MAG: hypothetical protein EOP49_40475, partial [Sphingobacteriales bacterium]